MPDEERKIIGKIIFYGIIILWSIIGIIKLYHFYNYFIDDHMWSIGLLAFAIFIFYVHDE